MIETIQDEGKTAEQATSRLLHELFSSVIVLFIVMFLFMWRRDALSSSISIPLVLGITFGISLLLGDNVNRITLFALILVLGMLVDDSIIVVENISRHIKQWDKKTNSLLPIILKATGEIGWAALFSTITKIVAFLGMFFVSGMMGQYMSPIPKYAIIALSVSLIVAFSVNPFLSYIFAIADQKAKDKTDSPLTKITQTLQKNLHPLTTIFHYLYLRILTYRESIHNFISRFIPLSRTKETSVPFLDRYEQLISSLLKHEAGDKRKYLKKVFWVVLAVLLITLPALWVFRWRMLPKSNVNQIYLWINADTDSSIDATQQLATDVNQRLSSYTIKNTNKDVPSSHHIIDTVSYWIGMAPTADFSNSFRWSAMRQQENNISMRINLMDKEHRNLSSEQFVLDLRPKLQSWINKHYPRAEFRLLEDPPWPPVKATWMLKVQSSTTTPQNLINTTANRLYQKLQQDLFIYDVVDHDSSIDRQPQSMEIKIDHEAIARAGLSVNQVAHTLYSLFEGIAVNTYHNPEAKEPLSIFIKVKNLITDYDSISFTNPQGQKVPLRTIATISPSTNNQIYYFDDGKPTTYLYGELGNNSVIYPMIDFLSKATNDAFREGRFHVEHRNLYEIQLRELWTDISYTISFWWERELSMDTFKDLGVALWLTLFMLYIIVSVRFNGFWIWGIVMLPFLFGFVWILPGYSILYFLTNEYFSATSMIGVIALAGISIGNSIILLEYVEELRHKGMDMRDALPLASKTRLKPIFLTSVTAIIGALMIIGDPVWSGLAWSIIRWLSVSAILTLILIPVFVYENHNKDHR